MLSSLEQDPQRHASGRLACISQSHVFDGIRTRPAPFSESMRFLFVVPFLALSACGLIEEPPSADGSSFPGGAGGDSSQPPLSVKCAPLSKGSQTGELVPPAPLTSLRVKADGCDPSFAGDVQYSWTAPAAGCYTISTLATRHAAPETLKVTRDTCDGSPVPTRSG